MLVLLTVLLARRLVQDLLLDAAEGLNKHGDILLRHMPLLDFAQAQLLI